MAKAEKNGFQREEQEEEKWAKHYSSNHEILLAGEGDFSFALSLALSFGSASNIVATSLDSCGVVIKKYKKAKSNLEMLEKLGASLLHEVDATKMKLHTDLQMRKFDRIIYNFPHAGFHGKENNVILIKMHKNLVRGFFKNASGMLRTNGEIHVNHKTTPPFCCWNLEELACQNFLALIECADFRKEDYPGYNNKRGAGDRCDDPFPLGKSGTFKFVLSSSAQKKTSRSKKNLKFSPCKNHHQIQDIPIHMLQQPPTPQLQDTRPRDIIQTHHHPNSLALSLPLVNLKVVMDVVPGSVWSPPANVVWIELDKIFDMYFKHMVVTFGRTHHDVRYSVYEALRLGFERYKAENPGNPFNYYITLLEELFRWSNLRLSFFQRMV